MNRKSGKVAFYDHDAGEIDEGSETLSPGVDFGEFLRLARILTELEAALVAGDLPPERQAYFRTRVGAVRTGLWEAWPYRYF